MKNETSHESFVLRPSTIDAAGVGVFILHRVARGTKMELFTEDFEEELRNAKELPEELHMFCLDQADGKLLCPKNFNRLDIGNYVNHSGAANLRFDLAEGVYYAKRDIEKDEELFADYRELGEPEEMWEDYYNN